MYAKNSMTTEEIDAVLCENFCDSCTEKESCEGCIVALATKKDCAPAAKPLQAVVEKLANTEANDFASEQKHWEFIASLRQEARAALSLTAKSTVCKNCNEGHVPIGENIYYATREMAMDACDLSLEGQPVDSEIVWGDCPCCGGSDWKNCPNCSGQTEEE